jgi:molybdopterin-containing oxidoreductase family iron-sulfur binding subunit
MKPAEPHLDLDALRRKLDGRQGSAFWRSLEELAETDGFRELLQREFPADAGRWDDPKGRRRFLKLMGASLAFAGLTGCTRQPEEKIVPYVRAPEEVVPGRPLYFATALSLAGFATGVLVESHMGRPTKIEGNPQHPASLGATDALTQAAILNLYDPDRARTPTYLGLIRTYGEFLAAFGTALAARKAQGGAGLRILTGSVSSPTLAARLEEILGELPEARWHQYEAVNRDNVRAGARLAFGTDVATRFRPGQADVIVALDADFLTAGPGSVAYAREFAARRRPGHDDGRMNRLYAVESMPTGTGAMADHRLPLAAGTIETWARALARELGLAVPTGAGSLPARAEQWAKVVARDLAAHRGAGLVIPGDGQPAAVHALAHAMNGRLGNRGRTVLTTDPVETRPVTQADSLRDLVEDMQAGRVEMLVIFDGNPAYASPADLDFAGALESVRLKVYVGSHADETAALCHWLVPGAHDLESWGDARAFDGTVSIVQPRIAPLHGGKTPLEILAAFGEDPNRSAHDIVRGYWQSRWGNFEKSWQRALHDGLVAGSALPARDIPLAGDWAGRLPRAASPGGGSDLEIVFRPDANVFDGRFTNNGWLQELPRPLSKLTWDNAAYLSPATAQRLDVGNEDLVRLTLDSRTVEAPVWIQPGHADGSVTVHLGYGRNRAGGVGDGAGFDAYALRTSRRPDFASGLQLSKTGRRLALACTQDHHSMEGRHLVRHADLSEYHHHPDFARHVAHEPGPEMSMFPRKAYEGHAWGMSVDLNACTGCNACVVACQAENNIPVVGKDEVSRGREMHWLRIDRYFEGGLENPTVHHQPVMCMHCENAPCEVVCPVAATVHSSEGLNDMVYNRCVGTRYCSNNCPYKVRRFNFMLYADWQTESLKLQANPDVSVRSRGVMEKCTYCVQRINGARIDASNQDRTIRDGDVITACQQACPTGAIVFGDINDKKSRVAREKEDSRSYGLLTELNTVPRTTYQASLGNPNPDLEEG